MRTMKTVLMAGRWALVATAALVVLGAGAADDADVQRCRTLSEAAARLACYDALPLSRPAVQAGPSVPAAAAAATSAPLPAPPAAVKTFGQERRDEPQALSSTIPGLFEGWGPRTRIRLANGQVWQVVDDSQGAYALIDAKVTVRRALLGGFVLEIAGANKAPRVRRVE